MRSAPEFRIAPALAALALTALLAAAARAAPPAPPGRVPSDAQIAAAVQTLEADPNLGEHKQRTLRWVDDKHPKPAGPHPAALQWLANLFEWFAQTSRFLFWAAVVVLAGFLGVFLVRLLRERPRAAAADRFTPPTHVREHDIRPESLPEDIGAAARQLWQSGQRRAALALLYRGLISRLVHVHGIPIRDSSTEGDCLALAAVALAESPKSFAARLMRLWQQSVYGGREPAAEAVFALCEEFSAALARGPGSPRSGGA